LAGICGPIHELLAKLAIVGVERPGREDFMFARRLSGLSFSARASLLAAIVMQGSACVGTSEGIRPANWSKKPDEPIRLPEAEQMIDELDRVMTSYGTISVKTPDVWGQDRLAKFRSEYESQMAEWLKLGFKGDINAAVHRGETESTLIQVGTNHGPTDSDASSIGDDGSLLHSMAQERASLNAGLPVSNPTVPRPPVSLEPSVVLDEHSNYLNHLNQLRRINAGDDLADRPGYGLYLVRIPVTLSPGPRSRRGKGAIISVSAKPVMTKHTLRSALRNVVINETVNNLTQAICHQGTDTCDQPAAPSAGPFSLISLADTEIFYGRASIERLREETQHQLARDLGDEPHHRTARVAGWLRGELETSYHLLEQAATSVRSPQLASIGDPLEEIGDQIARRDFTRIVQMQVHGMKDAQIERASVQAVHGELERSRRRAEVVNLLVFALRIQAAGVNRRLKQDMIDQDPSIKRETLRGLCFFEPEVSDEAMRAFEHYVNAKWPLRVYAIEPVIAQQNVADAYSRRVQTALDLVGSGPAGPARAIAGLTADRRFADDETAIRLNPTMVGFGAGQSTFGWVFYPRLQTRTGRDGRFLTDIALLLNGRLPDPIGNDQSIEPGQRECTALIEMPNFIPMLEFVTVANWFRTSEVGAGQRSNLEKASVLGRKLVAAEEVLKRVKVEGKSRPEEYLIAMERLEQLRDMMPTQRMLVRVPSSGDNNDSRIFCSLGLQLRPALVGWHGRPPEQGVESTLFVEGRNFSVHDTHVIAGGKPAKVVLVSRHLLKVTVASDASPTPSAEGSPLLDINVATPNGVSNHLLIKMTAPDPLRKLEPAEPVGVQTTPAKAEARKVALDKGDNRPDRPKP
jgi:hypothetical protein